MNTQKGRAGITIIKQRQLERHRRRERERERDWLYVSDSLL